MGVPGIDSLRAALESAVVGHEAAKTGLLLALVAREHALLEGPPGCAKTLLAELLATACGARVAFVRGHRDLREWELFGESVLLRRATRDGEWIGRSRRRAALFEAEVAILDDLDRAPGQALAPLLRVLGARRIGDTRLPLESAFATAAAPATAGFADPLEPTQLDRFAVQISLRGLVAADRVDEARRLLAQTPAAIPAPVLSSPERRALQRRAAELPVSTDARRALLAASARLARLGTSQAAPLVSDRFGAAALRLMRAHAFLHGARGVERCDVRALRFMLARRVPASERALAESLIEELATGAERRVVAAPAARRATPIGLQPGAAAGRVRAHPAAGDLRGADLDVIPRTSRARPTDVAPLLRALDGRLERGRASRGEDPGGQPRRIRRLRSFDEIFDADPVDVLGFVDGLLPGPPRVLGRERMRWGGILVLLRDVSASMEGLLARQSGDVLRSLIRTAARHRMRIGYAEFNHGVERHTLAGRFLHRRYRALEALASRDRAAGRTSYEAPLRLALRELSGCAGRDRHVVMLTDGVPVLGDPTVARERALARRLGVKVHTVYLGSGACPEVLDVLSHETGGLRFAARFEAGALHVVARAALPAAPSPAAARGVAS